MNGMPTPSRRNADSEQGIPQGYASVGERSGIDHNESDSILAGGVNAVEQGVFGVALEAGQLVRPQFPRQFHTTSFDISQGGGTVDSGLAGAQQIQIRSVQ